jgi:hypothetical protein
MGKAATTVSDELLLKRLEALERRYMRLHQGMLGLASLLILTWLTPFLSHFPARAHAQAGKTIVKANEFQLIDGNKKVRLVLGYDKNKTGLRLFDETGQSRVSLVLNQGKPGLSIVDAKGVPQIAVGLRNQKPFVGLCGKAGEARIGMTMNRDQPMLLLLDRKNKPRVGLTTPRGEPMFMMFDKEGRPRSVYALKNNEPYMAMLDTNARSRLGFGLDAKSAAEFRVLSEDGKLIWQLPNSSKTTKKPDQDGKK